MTQDGLIQLARLARDEHASVAELTPAQWHLAAPKVQRGWLAAVALVVSRVKSLHQDAELNRLRAALHSISLASQNSTSSIDECGRIARTALGGVPEMKGARA